MADEKTWDCRNVVMSWNILRAAAEVCRASVQEVEADADGQRPCSWELTALRWRPR